MTAMTSVVPAVIDYLVAAAQSSVLLGANTTAPVAVYDGPQPPGPGQQDQSALWIGADPSLPGDPVAQASQAFAVMDKARTRDEDGAIALTAQHWSGDTTNKVHRDGAAAIVAGVEVLLRGLPSAGGPGDATMGGLVMWSEVSGPFDWRPRQVSSGALCLVTFHVTYRARLTTS